MTTAITASTNPARVLGGKGKLVRAAPTELCDVLFDSMGCFDWRPTKFYVRSLSQNVGFG